VLPLIYPTRLLPVDYDRQRRKLLLAVADPSNVVALDQIRALVPEDIRIEQVLARESDISIGIEQHYGFELSIDGILNEIETGEIDYQSLTSDFDEYSQPVVRLVDALLNDAVKRNASDIHFEPEQGFLRIRYRVDGVLRQIRSLHKNYWSAMVVRLKVMSGMNIAETRAPQDGRISLSLSGRAIDFRVSAQPTTHGENIVLRILDRQKGIVPLEELGLREHELKLLRLMMARPEGIILVTGPTGSGKTTTLYSILNQINTEGVNIMTLEDPVEYPMGMIRQTSVNEVAKLDFASGIRSMMRQDPDVILVGEIRDHDTAEMAFRAAMTGHQVYSTLHTNSAIGAIPRLQDLGVLPDIMAGNIIGVVAQRLVRCLCVHCKEAYRPDDEMTLRILGVAPIWRGEIFRAKGCTDCDNTGYRGRAAIMELFTIDEEMDELIARRATGREVREAARKTGYRTLAEDAVSRVIDGLTDIAEISRVVNLTDRVR
jgi:type II secretory ATPase GspE/PulE/Tfp pilus assembly ATPase PilB-like protein